MKKAMDYKLIDKETLDSTFRSLRKEKVIIDLHDKNCAPPAYLAESFTYQKVENTYYFGDNLPNDDDYDYQYTINTDRVIAINYVSAVPQISGQVLRLDFYNGAYITIKQLSGFGEMDK